MVKNNFYQITNLRLNNIKKLFDLNFLRLKVNSLFNKYVANK